MATPTQKRLIQKRLTDIRKAKNTPWSKGFKWTGFSGKTLWDWLNLLGVFLIPIVVVGATIGFGWWQVHLADVQHQQDQASALDQQRAAILQTYMDNIQDLLLNHHLLVSKPTDDVAVLARARTLTALQGLDPDRKGSLVQFLYEAQLIGFWDSTDKLHGTIIDLNGAHLDYANLNNANFSGADLSEANLSYANLNNANFSGADLTVAHLDYADLNGADLNGAYFNGAYLNGAYLNGAYLNGADLNGADLTVAYLNNANFSGADLTVAYLNNANFSGADLTVADLNGADLNGADLNGADLSFADFNGARNLTQRHLDQVLSCLGAILPQGLTCHHNPYVSSGSTSLKRTSETSSDDT